MLQTRILTVRPEESAFSTLTDVAGVQLELHFYWRAKTASWYLDIENPETGEYLGRSARLAPGGSPYFTNGIGEGPFVLAVVGDDYTKQSDLGVKFQVLLIDEVLE